MVGGLGGASGDFSQTPRDFARFLPGYNGYNAGVWEFTY